MTGIQDAVQEYLKAPLASTLPQLAFLMAGLSASNSSTQLEEGLHQMSNVITGMSDQGSQGSRGSRRNTWKKVLEKTVIPKKRWEKEEDEAGNILFYYPEFFNLPYDR